MLIKTLTDNFGKRYTRNQVAGCARWVAETEHGALERINPGKLASLFEINTAS